MLATLSLVDRHMPLQAGGRPYIGNVRSYSGPEVKIWKWRGGQNWMEIKKAPTGDGQGFEIKPLKI